jgi:hypothetical protein
VLYLLVVAAVSAGSDPINTESPALAHGFGHTASWAGTIVGAFGVGAVIAAFAIAGRITVTRETMMLTLTTMVVGMIAFALSPWLPLAWVFLAVAGCGYLVSNASATTRLQLGVDEHERGRIMSSTARLPARSASGLRSSRWPSRRSPARLLPRGSGCRFPPRRAADRSEDVRFGSVGVSAPGVTHAHLRANGYDGAADLETGPRRRRRPAVEHAAGSTRRFVLATLASAAALLLAVLAFDAVVDPWGQLGTGLFPTLIPTDRPVKVGLIDRLLRPPQFVVLGSSRALKIDPAYLQRKLGQRGFNAAVSDGQPEDAWAFLHLIHRRFPNARPQSRRSAARRIPVCSTARSSRARFRPRSAGRRARKASCRSSRGRGCAHR